MAGNAPKIKNAKKSRKKKDELTQINEQIESLIKKWIEVRDGIPCLSLLIDPRLIDATLIDDVYDELRENFTEDDGRLDVIVHSGGGDIDAAYNLAQLLRRYGSKHLAFIVPRWAKSAATMLVCAGDKILMTPVAELGPLDPQITEMNPLEGRLERFSPLHIDSTLQLIRDEYSSGNAKLAEGLLQRLQFPLTLGKYRWAIKIGREYITKLLSSRMLKNKKDVVEDIAQNLTTGFADHAYCIGLEEAQKLGLAAEELTKEQTDIIWKLYRLAERRHELIKKKREEKTRKRLRDLPPEIRELIPDLIDQRKKE
ncbi:MAG: hypothetical protein AB1345_08525 [Chloroflexota bacterium]